MPVIVCLDCHHEWAATWHRPGAKIACPKCGSEAVATSPRMRPRA